MTDARITCPDCGAESNRSARRCRCGHVLSTSTLHGPRRFVPVWAVGIVAAGWYGYSSYAEGTRGVVPLLVCAGFGAVAVLVPLFAQWLNRQ